MIMEKHLKSIEKMEYQIPMSEVILIENEGVICMSGNASAKDPSEGNIIDVFETVSVGLFEEGY